jgi:hypothetical protein
VTPRLLTLLGSLLAVAQGGAGRAAEAGPETTEAESLVLAAEQTLEDLATQLFADPRAADELRALNDLAPGAQPPVGQRLRLPGRARRPAVTALGVARQALQEARLQGAAEFAEARFQEAEARLEAAEAACGRADYTACQAGADEGFALARLARQDSLARRASANRFAVSVDPEGGTRVEVLSGDGVEVTAQAQSARLRPGQGLVVKPGSAPPRPESLPEPPAAILPNLDSRLITPSILFTWQASPTAQRYVLLIARDAAGLRPVRQLTVRDTAFLFQSNLPDGEYYWFLRSVNARGAVGRASPARRFSLQSRGGQDIRVETPDPAPGEPPP